VPSAKVVGTLRVPSAKVVGTLRVPSAKVAGTLRVPSAKVTAHGVCLLPLLNNFAEQVAADFVV